MKGIRNHYSGPFRTIEDQTALSIFPDYNLILKIISAQSMQNRHFGSGGCPQFAQKFPLPYSCPLVIRRV